MNLSIIIPVLNEREQLPHMVAQLQNFCPQAEIIVADGGSTDGTREWLQQQTNIQFTDAPKGRGNQQNAGAQIAQGNVLFFLHADCAISAQTFSHIKNALAHPQICGGAFTIRFTEHEESLSLRIIAKGINARTRVTKTATGDQGVFVRQEIFAALGGFQAWPFFEDVKLVADIKKRGVFKIICDPLTISGRRYLANGPWRTTFLMYALRVGYWLKIHPQTLFRWFQDVRSHLKNN